MKAIQFRKISFIIPVLISIFCSNNPVNNSSDDTGNGFFTIITPSAEDSVKIGDTLNILWKSSDELNDTADISIQLYKNTEKIDTIAGSVKNLGFFRWKVGNYGSGDGYQIKLCKLGDTLTYDFSGYFSLYSEYSGGFAFKSPEKGEQLMIDSSFTIEWSKSGSPGENMRLVLYKDTVPLNNIVSSISSDSGSYHWRNVRSSLGSGKRYRIKGVSLSDSGIYSYSSYFQIASPYSGEYSFKTPTDSMTWSAGFSYSITWDTTGSLSSSVQLELYKGSDSVLTIDSYTSASDSYRWEIPDYITSGDSYRIKISCYSDPAISSFSPEFTIEGVDPDEYEYDNTKATSNAIAVKDTQYHSITLNDTDWISFNATEGKSYVILKNNIDNFRSEFLLFNSDSCVYADSAWGTGYLIDIWEAQESGTHYIRMRGDTVNAAGEYYFHISEFDSLSSVEFLNPTENTILQTGESFDIEWETDQVFLGFVVDIDLYKGNKKLSTIVNSSDNDGLYTWEIPEGYATGDDYRLKLGNAHEHNLFGLTQNFKIEGTSPDDYENDDTRQKVVNLPHDSLQNRNITLYDTDWVSFSADSGTDYSIVCKGDGEFTTEILIYYQDSTGYLTRETGSSNESNIFLWECNRSGTYDVSITSNNSESVGSYKLKIAPFDPETALSFNNPESSSLWIHDTTETITWEPDPLLFDTIVNLYLYSSGSLREGLNTDPVPNDGNFTWQVANDINSGDDYRVRVVSSADTSIYGISPVFSISKLPPDSYEDDNTEANASELPLNTTQNHNLTCNDTDWIRFNTTKGGIYTVSGNYDSCVSRMDIELQGGDNSEAIVPESNRIHHSFRAGNTGISYLVFSYSYSSEPGEYSVKITKLDTLNSVEFISPDLDGMLYADSTYKASWSLDHSVFGSSVNLYLYKDSEYSYFIERSSDDTATFTIPQNIMSDDDYKLKIISDDNSLIRGYSKSFSIEGVSADDYEPDYNRSTASSIDFGKEQIHNLTFNDTDWVKFNAEKGERYIILDNSYGDGYRKVLSKLYYGDNTTDLIDISNSRISDVALWECEESGVYYNKMMPYSSDDGDSLIEYPLRILRFDSTSNVTFISPDSNDSFEPNETIEVEWVPDSVLLSDFVQVSLYMGDSHVSSSSSLTYNTGNYSFELPADMVKSEDYRLKISPWQSSEIFGFSSYFAINGREIAQDEYEIDDNREQATLVSFDSMQSRSMRYSNDDWLKFYAESGSKYLIRGELPDTSSIKLSLYRDEQEKYWEYTGTYFMSGYFECQVSDTFYLKFSNLNSSTIINEYLFKLQKTDALPSINIDEPVSSTVWDSESPGQIIWSADETVYSEKVEIAVYKDGNFLYDRIEDNSGDIDFSVSGCLETGDDYKIKIMSPFDSVLAGATPEFTINALEPDSYEPDGSDETAKQITIDSPQTHNFTYNDSDYVFFNADSNTVYTITRNSDIRELEFTIFNPNMRRIDTHFSYTRDTTDSFTLESTDKGKYYIRVSNSTSYCSTSDYTIEISEE